MGDCCYMQITCRRQDKERSLDENIFRTALIFNQLKSDKSSSPTRDG